MNPILDSIQSITEEARRALADPELTRAQLLSALSVRPPAHSLYVVFTIHQALIDENHVHLANLGVSHRTLETIRAKTIEQPYHLSTKLTGAGGGGCAVTLLPDSSFSFSRLILHELNLQYRYRKAKVRLPDRSSPTRRV